MRFSWELNKVKIMNLPGEVQGVIEKKAFALTVAGCGETQGADPGGSQDPTRAAGPLLCSTAPASPRPSTLGRRDEKE